MQCKPTNILRGPSDGLEGRGNSEGKEKKLIVLPFRTRGKGKRKLIACPTKEGIAFGNTKGITGRGTMRAAKEEAIFLWRKKGKTQLKDKLRPLTGKEKEFLRG